MTRLGLAAAAVVLAVAAVACGTPSKDLFVVERSGEGPGAKLTLLVSDDGSVRCNGEKPREIGSERLIDARGIERELSEQLDVRRVFPPGPDAVLSYSVRLQDGTLEFSDTSRRLPPELLELAAFTRELAKQVCGLDR